MPTKMPWDHVPGMDIETPGAIPNVATPEGRELGRELARLADAEYAKTGSDSRCETCAFRHGEHIANGSPATLMSAFKCVMEQTPFWCHESERLCGGWVAAINAGRKVEQ